MTELGYPSGALLEPPDDTILVGVDFGKEPFTVVFFDSQMRVIERKTIDRNQIETEGEIKDEEIKPRVRPGSMPSAHVSEADAFAAAERVEAGQPKYRTVTARSEAQQEYDSDRDFYSDDFITLDEITNPSEVRVTPDEADEAFFHRRAIDLEERVENAKAVDSQESREQYLNAKDSRVLPDRGVGSDIREMFARCGWKERADDLWGHSRIGGAYNWRNVILRMACCASHEERHFQPQVDGGHFHEVGVTEGPDWREGSAFENLDYQQQDVIRKHSITLAKLSSQNREIREQIWVTKFSDEDKLADLGEKLAQNAMDQAHCIEVINRVRKRA